MKTLLILVSTIGVLSAQTIYKLTPGTKDNKIILTIENSSEETNMSNINVVVNNNISAIKFHKLSRIIDEIKDCQSKEVEFAFDVDRIVDVNSTDTLNFLISSKSGSWTKEILIGYDLPKEFKLEQNYPNPFNPTTTIEFSLPKDGKYVIRVFNILGELVKVLADKNFEAGYHKIIFDAGRISSGVYIYTLIGDDVNLIKKMIVLK